MGKGARNRAKRQREACAPGLTQDLLGRLFELRSAHDLTALLREHPELHSRQVLNELRRLSEHEAFGAPFARFRRLLAVGRTDPERAWSEYAGGSAADDARRERLDRLGHEIRAALEAGEHDRAISAGQEAIELAKALGLGLTVAQLLGDVAMARFRRVSSDRANDLERAIEELEAAVPLAAPGIHRAALLMDLGMVNAERVVGDRDENLDRALVCMRNALAELENDDALAESDEDDVLELRAMLQTNLAVVQIRVATSASSLMEAVALCESALTYRKPEHDANNWAYTQLNLAEAQVALAARDEMDRAEAARTLNLILEYRDLITDPALLGATHHALGRLYLDAGTMTAEDLVVASERDDPLERADGVMLLTAARDHLQAARELMRSGDRIQYARVLDDLSDVLGRLGQDELALNVAVEALDIAAPTVAPSICVSLGFRAGGLLGERGEWQRAAAAYLAAVQAADLIFHGQVSTEARERELRRIGNLNRWAAFAVARAGDAEKAALLLENGRTREFRRRLGIESTDRSRLDVLPSRVRREFDAAARRLATAPTGDAGREAAREFQRTVAAIREIPGFENFLRESTLDDLAAAVEAEWPVVYVNPTPYGTVLLLVHTRESAIEVRAEFLEEPTSMDIFLRLVAGEAAGDSAVKSDRPPASYLFGISGGAASEERDSKVDLDQTLPWIGDMVSKHVADLVGDLGCVGVTLIACGPLGLVPLHAAPWQTDGRDEVLLDRVYVRYAPSAVVAAASLRRAKEAETDRPFLVAVADPTQDLPAAVAEVAEIARRFSGAQTRVAKGRAGDFAFLKRWAKMASILHLACHANGGLFDAEDAAVVLADGAVAADRLPEVGPLRARLVVVSACESALSEIAGLPNEVYSVGTAFLASGAASTVAGLWQVDDLATAVLMTKVYEEMLGGASRPPEALSAAQRWMRQLTARDLRAFLNDHPRLKDEAVRRGLYPAVADGERAVPWVHPDYWAAFLALGV